MESVPHLMYQNVRLNVLNIRPGRPANHTCAYRVSKNDEHMIIKEWKKCMDIRKEVLGSNIARKARIGDRIISISIMESQGLSCFMLFYPRKYSRS